MYSEPKARFTTTRVKITISTKLYKLFYHLRAAKVNFLLRDSWAAHNELSQDIWGKNAYFICFVLLYLKVQSGSTLNWSGFWFNEFCTIIMFGFKKEIISGRVHPSFENTSVRVTSQIRKICDHSCCRQPFTNYLRMCLSKTFNWIAL